MHFNQMNLYSSAILKSESREKYMSIKKILASFSLKSGTTTCFRTGLILIVVSDVSHISMQTFLCVFKLRSLDRLFKNTLLCRASS